MFAAITSIRQDERPRVYAASATLFAFMAGHTILETARDALFLSHIPVQRLPWMYLAIAIFAIGVVELQPATRSRRGLALQIGLSSLVTLCFWPLTAKTSDAFVYVLYAWAGVSATLVLAQFWVAAAAEFTSTQAKRVYPLIGAGGVFGAIAGAMTAAVLSQYLSTRSLLIAAAVFIAFAAVVALRMQSAAPHSGPAPRVDLALARRVAADGYARKLGLLIVVAAVTLTLVDYLFKSAVAEQVADGELAAFFARFYLGLNVASLVLQMLLVPVVVRALGVHGGSAVLPGLVASLAGVTLLGTGFYGVLGLKAADGALRYSLHRTVTELAFLPMGDRLRSAARILLDGIGQRLGQALASLAILAAIAVGAGSSALAAAVLGLGLVWLTLLWPLRREYYELFRRTLREVAREAPQRRLPDLDLQGLEAILQALNSRNDLEVRAALDALEEEGRARLIPALILYHPAPEVVVAALDILTRAGRDDIVPIIERLLTHPSADIRAAALRARTRLAPDPKVVCNMVRDPHAAVRATALVCIEALHCCTAGSESELEKVLSGEDLEAKVALARAIQEAGEPRLERAIIRLGEDADPLVRRAALEAMVAHPSETHLPVLLSALTRRRERPSARAALLALGEPARSALVQALQDPSTEVALRRHLPRTLMHFEADGVLGVLVNCLLIERDGVTHYKILRALDHLRKSEPRSHFPPAAMTRALEATANRAWELLSWRLTLEAGAGQDDARRTEAHELLTGLLRSKEQHAIDRLFLILGLMYPRDEVRSIMRGLQSSRAAVRASSRELLEHLLAPRWRAAILGLTEDASDAERLAQAPPTLGARGLDYDQLLSILIESPSESIRSIAVYHVAELGIDGLRSRLLALQPSSFGSFADVLRRALDRMTPSAQLETA